MNDRKEYLKNYRLNNKEKYRQYQAKYRKNHLSTYEKLKQENYQLKEDNFKLQARADKYKCRIDKAIEYIKEYELFNYKYDDEEMFEIVTDEIATNKLLEILGDNNEC